MFASFIRKTRRPVRSAHRSNTIQPVFESLESRFLLTTIGFVIEKPPYSPGPYRSYDGTGNNLAHPTWGSANVDLLRKSPVAYADGVSAPARPDDPSARAISDAVVEQIAPTVNDRYMSDFIYVWGQFIDHDLDLTPTDDEEFDVPVPPGDPYFDPGNTGTQVIPFFRSVYDPATGTDITNPRQQVNTVTSYLDGSMIYGSDPLRANALRSHVGGKLLTSDGVTNGVGNLLPLNKNLVPATPDNPEGMLPNNNDAQILPDDQLFVAGDVRVNENIELTAIQTLFLREHNRLAAQFAAQNPRLTDEQIYQQARQYVIAELQSITYNEWIPALLGNNALSPYRGYNPNVNATIANEFSTVALRVGHSMVGNDVSFVDNSGQEVLSVPLSDAFSNPDLIKQYGIDLILKGRASDNSEEIDTMIVDGLRNLLFGDPGMGGADLASFNIQRGRDHGLPDYNTLRAAYGLPRVTSFAQITSDPLTQQRLASVYPTVDDIDPWVGGLAEDHVPGSSTGPLFRRILLDQFQRTRDGDRYWYERNFSDSQACQLEDTHLSDIIQRNTTISNIQKNAFFFKTAITGTVFNDANGNGRQDRYETGLPGQTLQLLDGNGNPVLDDNGDAIVTVTNSRGDYSFQGVGLGTFQVAQVIQPGWKQTTPSPGNIVITRGQTIDDVDFGDRKSIFR